MQVVEVKGKGHGVITTRQFKKGELLCKYSGRLLSHKEGIKKEREYAKDPNIGCYLYFFKYRNKTFGQWHMLDCHVISCLALSIQMRVCHMVNKNLVLSFLAFHSAWMPQRTIIGLEGWSITVRQQPML